MQDRKYASMSKNRPCMTSLHDDAKEENREDGDRAREKKMYEARVRMAVKWFNDQCASTDHKSSLENMYKEIVTWFVIGSTYNLLVLNRLKSQFSLGKTRFVKARLKRKPIFLEIQFWLSHILCRYGNDNDGTNTDDNNNDSDRNSNNKPRNDNGFK